MKMYEPSKKVTQKKLCQIAKCLGAIRLSKGCYSYESILYSDRKLIDTLGLKTYDDNFANNAYIHKNQLYYSCGLYGNSGQLHYITYLNEYGVESYLYVYYTDIDYNNDYR